MLRLASAVACWLACATLGCDSLRIEPGTTGEAPASTAAGPDTAPPSPPPQAVDNAAPAPGGDVVQVPAEVGVGQQGRSLDHEQGGVTQVLVEPARSLFATRERLVFEVQIPQALNLYRATNGKLPESHEEFMREIIEANRIQLPRLPEGQRYVWNPEAGELMVERPR